MNFLNKILFLITLMTLTSCNKQSLTVYSQYVTKNDLASYRVETPDPLLYNPPTGQRIMIEWALSNKVLDFPDLHVELTVRLRNRQEIKRSYPVRSSHGEADFELLNDAFFDSGGILTYKVQVIGGGYILDEWTHQLWKELIQLE